MEKIHTEISLNLNDVELNISVKEDLTALDGVLKNWGFIRITDGCLDTKPIFWDGLDYFTSCGKKQFKKECKEELKNAGYEWREIYKIIKSLLRRAEKLNILDFEK